MVRFYYLIKTLTGPRSIWSKGFEIRYAEKWELKKLDSDNSFRLGVGVSTIYTPIIGKVIRILEKILNIKHQILDTESGQ